jgi:hypothetical protein
MDDYNKYSLDDIKNLISETKDEKLKEMFYDLGYLKFGINLRLI